MSKNPFTGPNEEHLAAAWENGERIRKPRERVLIALLVVGAVLVLAWAWKLV